VSGRLERSRTDRVIGGVCGGIAEYLDVDPTFVRVAMVILGFFGIGILVYFVLLILMPNPGEPAPFARATDGTTTVTDPAVAPAVAPRRVADPAEVERRRYALGILLVGVGVLFFLGNLGLFRFLEWRNIWPLVFIAAGLYVIAQRARR
jgi:phage shock protein C